MDAMSATGNATAFDTGLDEVAPGGSVFVGLLWFVAIAFMFFAQHHVCDAYFIPAIDVFTDKMRNSTTRAVQKWGEEAVAGATICALGCNGPELFCNFIALYTHSDAGIGVVVGSEIFNLLVIIGATIIAAPVVPLALDPVPFTRDCAFYFLSIVMLYFSLADKMITWQEAYLLLAAAGVYVLAVYFTSDVEAKLMGTEKEAADEQGAAEKGRTASIHGIEVQVEEVLHSRMADSRRSRKRQSCTMNTTDNARGIMCVSEEEIMAEQAARKAKGKRHTVGINMGDHGGEGSLLGSQNILLYKYLNEVVVKEGGTLELEFQKGQFYRSTLRVKCQGTVQRDELLAMIQEHDEKMWVHKYDPTVKGAWDSFRHEIAHQPLAGKLGAVAEFLIDVLLKGTLWWCDVKKVGLEGKWPLCFAGAMTWLAVFSWVMLEIANQINYNIPSLPSAFLGITVCAVGTSFPNAVASIIMAAQDKPAAAIANALGSNVQNVFLAMAMPWVIYCTQHNFKPVPQSVEGINEGVFWMLVTLLLLIFMVIPGRCTLNKGYGYVLCVVYIAWLTLTSGETFGWWPRLFN